MDASPHADAGAAARGRSAAQAPPPGTVFGLTVPMSGSGRASIGCRRGGAAASVGTARQPPRRPPPGAAPSLTQASNASQQAAASGDAMVAACGGGVWGDAAGRHRQPFAPPLIISLRPLARFHRRQPPPPPDRRRVGRAAHRVRADERGAG